MMDGGLGWLVVVILVPIAALVAWAFWSVSAEQRRDEEALARVSQMRAYEAMAQQQRYWRTVAEQAALGNAWAQAELDSKRRADYLAEEIARRTPPPPPLPQQQPVVFFFWWHH